jgi:predicted RNA-binding protein with PUA-like domain
MRPGDRVLIYHSMGQPAIAGVAEVTAEPRPDPRNAKSWVVDLKFLQRVEPPVTLAAIKATGEFDAWSLIRQSRLSTMPAPDEFIAWLRRTHPALGKL